MSVDTKQKPDAKPAGSAPEKRWKLKSYFSPRLVGVVRMIGDGSAVDELLKTHVGNDMYLSGWSTPTEQEAWSRASEMHGIFEMLVKFAGLAQITLDGTDFLVIEAIQVD